MEQVTETAPGIAQFAGVYDVVSETVTLHGGTTGCFGPDCADFDDLYQVTGDSRLDPALLGYDELYGANLPYVFEFDATTGDLTGASSVDLAYWLDYGSYSGYSCDEAALSTYGVQRAGGAFLGAEWSQTARSWSLGDLGALHFLFGGTMHQIVHPAAEHVTEGCTRELTLPVEGPDGSALVCLPPLQACVSAGFDFIDRADCGIADATQGIVPEGQNAVAYVYDASGSTYDPIGFDDKISSRYAVALASLGGEYVLAVGGKNGDDANGLASAWRLNADTGDARWLDTGDMPGRYGAGAVYDPVQGVTYIWGGADSDDRTWTYRHQFRSPNKGAKLTLTPMDVSFEYRSGDWFSSTTLTATVDADTYVEDVWLYLGSDDLVEVRNAPLTVTYGDLQTFDLSVRSEAIAVEGVFPISVRLPRTVEPGESLTFRLNDWKRTVETTAFGKKVTFETATGADRFHRFAYGMGADERAGYASPGLPLWAHADIAVGDDAIPAEVHSLSIVAPPGYAVVFGDEPATGAGTSSVTFAL